MTIGGDQEGDRAPAVPEMTHRRAKLAGRTDAGGGFFDLHLEIPEGVAGTFGVPGQYVHVRAAGEGGYFALTGNPGEGSWGLLTRDGGGASQHLVTLPLGALVEVTDALGAGFPCDGARGVGLAVLVTGSGIAAARPVVRRRIAEGDGPRTHLFVGVRSAADLPWRGELEAYAHAGVEVTVALSREVRGARDGPESPSPEPSPGLRFTSGYVQDALRHAEATRSPGARRQVFAVGVAPMVESLRALAPHLGLTAADIQTNY